MRKIFTCCLSLLSLVMFGQAFPDFDTSKNTPGKKAVLIRIRCRATPTIAKEPIWIVDGVIAEPWMIKTINPDDIESIAILKDVAALALYGSRAAEGVIIITTKSAKERKIYIKDILTGNQIAAATVLLIAKKNRRDTLMFTTNDSGVVVTDKAKAGQQYRITITSVGYKRLETIYYATEKVTNFVLEKDIIECQPVTIHSPGIITCTRIIKTVCRQISRNNSRSAENIVSKDIASAAVYPNPVQRGTVLTVQLDNAREGFVQVGVIGIDGRQLIMQTKKVNKGTNRLFLNADNRWAAGVYFVQLSDENKKLIRQEKILVQ